MSTHSSNPEQREVSSIRREIEVTRDRLSETLGALSQELSPTRMKSEASAAIAEKAGDIAMKTRSYARDNAVPLVLIGSGAALLVRTRRSRRQDDGARDRIRDADRSTSTSYDADGSRSHRQEPPFAYREESMSASATGAGEEQASDLMQSAAETTTRWVSRLQEGSRQAVTRTSEQARKGYAAASDQVRRGRDRADRFYDDQPLLAGLAALAAGLAIGAAIPTSRIEHERMGPYRDELLGRASHRAERTLQAAQRQIEETSSNLADKLPGSSVTTSSDQP